MLPHLKVIGPSKLSGKVVIGSAKNACLPILAATLLSSKKITLKDLPSLVDIEMMLLLLENMGVEISKEEGKHHFSFQEGQITPRAPYEIVRKMRASILVLGPLLARFKKAQVSLPGGCAIGVRPVNFHLDALKKMGATIDVVGGVVEASCSYLQGTKITLPFPSVGATENILMAAALAQGETCLENSALEPEIDDLINFLNFLGGKISRGEKDPKQIFIQGVSSLDQEGEYRCMSDRVQAATYLIAGLITRSPLQIAGLEAQALVAEMDLFREIGAQFCWDDQGIFHLKESSDKLQKFTCETAPFPGIATDIQAQLMALATTLEGPSIIHENIFENRFMHVPELVRMGAKIELEGSRATIMGGQKLTGAQVMCTDLRASAALVLAAMVAEGESTIRRIYHLQRGYDLLHEKMASLGAQISFVH